MIVTKRITLEDFWNSAGREEVLRCSSYGSMQEYDANMRKLILPQMGQMQVRHISSEDIERLLRSFMRDISVRRAIGARALLHKLFHIANLQGIRPDNPVNGVTLVGRQEREVFGYNYEACVQLLRAFRELPLGRLYTFQFLSGLSRCEVLGIRAGGIDIGSATITIDQFGLKDGSGRINIYRECRSFVSRRITIPEAAMRVLLKELEYRDRRKKECGKAWHNDYDLVFTNETGGPVGLGALIYSRQKLNRICDVSVKNFLSTKNNFAIMALKQGINPADLKIYLGYKSYETIAVMTMSNRNIRGETADLLEALYNEGRRADLLEAVYNERSRME